MIVYEVIQMVFTKEYYWHDFWNYVDIFRALIVFPCITIYVMDLSTEMKELLLALLTLLSFIRGISYFRIFSMTRYLVNMI
jgi:hypothetical protein